MTASERSGCNRLRVNVTALVNDEALSKFLVVLDEESGMDQLVHKVNQSLRRHGFPGNIERVLNSFKAVLPSDEAIGDMLRDGEDVFVVVGNDCEFPPNQPSSRGTHALHVPTGGPGPVSRQQAREPTKIAAAATVPMHSPSFAGLSVSNVDTAATQPVRAVVTLPVSFNQDDSSDEEETIARTEREPLQRLSPHDDAYIPGPSEEFDVERMPYESIHVDHPCDPVQLTCMDNDWLVENLTPKLRQFVMSNFQPDLITEPKYVASIGKFVSARFREDSGAFISVFMRPQTSLGSDPNATMPVHYHIAKSDIKSFQQHAENHIKRTHEHRDLFAVASNSLLSLLNKGMSQSDHVGVMLPQRYHAFEEVEGMMLEADRPMLPMKTTGMNPVIIVDTSGAAGAHLPYIKAGLKRALHASMASKSSFQLIRFMPGSGEPRLWAQEMMRPMDVALQSAEDWIDSLHAVGNGRLVSGIRAALAHDSCDEIYVLSSADMLDQTQHDATLKSIRALNKREAAIHTVAIESEPRGELLLRNIAESNHGDCVLKQFNSFGRKGTSISSHDSKWSSWRTNLVNDKTRKLADTFKQQKMSIASQLRIIEIMLREEDTKESFWKEERRCAKRLLVNEASNRNLTQQTRDLERQSSKTLAARIGGGYAYHTGQVPLGLEHLFEHKTAVPWTEHTDTVAGGPKIPLMEALQSRQARFPPSNELLPQALEHDMEGIIRTAKQVQPSVRQRSPARGSGTSSKYSAVRSSRARNQASNGARPRAASADRTTSPAPNSRQFRATTHGSKDLRIKALPKASSSPERRTVQTRDPFPTELPAEAPQFRRERRWSF